MRCSHNPPMHPCLILGMLPSKGRSFDLPRYMNFNPLFRFEDWMISVPAESTNSMLRWPLRRAVSGTTCCWVRWGEIRGCTGLLDLPHHGGTDANVMIRCGVAEKHCKHAKIGISFAWIFFGYHGTCGVCIESTKKTIYEIYHVEPLNQNLTIELRYASNALWNSNPTIRHYQTMNFLAIKLIRVSHNFLKDLGAIVLQTGLINLLLFMEAILTKVGRTTSIFECQRQEISLLSLEWFVWSIVSCPAFLRIFFKDHFLKSMS